MSKELKAFGLYVLIIVVVILAILIAGCATIEPNSIKTEYTHLSHITEHFGSDKQDYGINAIGLVARWNLPGFYVEIGEGVSVDHHTNNITHEQEMGAFYGPREQTTVRIGQEWRLK
jgi:hypothetical protein